MMTLEGLNAAIKAPALDRVTRYMKRVEAHLPTFADDAARYAFLKREEAKWVERYQSWAFRIDTDTASKTDLTQTAFDYIETLAAVRKRAEDFKPQEAA